VRGAVAGVDDDRVVADPLGGELIAPEVVEAVGLRVQASDEGASLTHAGCSLSLA
jgi:hypothetical protein